METKARKTKKSSARTLSDAEIREAYISHLLQHGTPPASVFKFCTTLGITEQDFYQHFGSFTGVEKAIWKNFLTTATERLKADNAYAGFSSREKILAFYYTFFEDLLASRSFVLLQLSRHNKLEITPEFLGDFKIAFEEYVNGVLTVGKSSGEVANRPYLDKGYPKVFWLHMGFLLTFWKNDNSPGFENTDAAIEKSVNLAFDLIGKGAVDTALDFAKFLYQTK